MDNTQAISLTNNYLIPNIYHLAENDREINFRGKCKRELLPRLLACTTFIFRTADFFVNMAYGIACGISFSLRKFSIRWIYDDNYDSEKVKSYFSAAKEAVFKNPFQMFTLILNPKATKKMLLDNIPVNFPDSLIEIDRKKIAEVLQNTYRGNLDSNWGLKEFFGHIYVLNMDDNPNSGDPEKCKRRLETTAEHLHSIGLKKGEFERYRAINGSLELDPPNLWHKIDDDSYKNKTQEELDKLHKGQAGNYMSHYGIIKDASDKYKAASKQFVEAKKKYEEASSADKIKMQESLREIAKKVKEYSSILVIEDDNGFGFLERGDDRQLQGVLKGTGKYFYDVMKDLPKDWDLFYFMAEHYYARNIVPHTTNLNRLKYAVCLNAYAINCTGYDAILKKLSTIFDASVPKVRPTDHMIASLHETHKVYVPKKPLAYQRAGKSTISGGDGAEHWNGLHPRDF